MKREINALVKPLTKTQLKAQIDKGGSLDTVYKECRRYGEIIYKSDYEYTYTVNFKTNEKVTDLVTAIYISYKDLYWHFELVKGEVKTAGWSINKPSIVGL